MNIPMVDLKVQHASIKDEIDAAIARVLENGMFILGAEVKDFEQAMASYLGIKHGIGVASGTDALQLALIAAGVGPGDKVITTPFTFIATAETIAKCGARPIFVDIDADTYNIDTDKLEELLTSKIKDRSTIKAILPVHLYGHMVDMNPILQLAKKYEVKVIEDSAQSLGSLYDMNYSSDYSESADWKQSGTIGDVGCLSFFPRFLVHMATAEWL
jgi:dTDP-4-amino-4,6-dideoxygalactose transaminase